MSNVIDSIQLSGVTYAIQGSGGGGIPESAFTAYTASTDSRIAEDEEVTAAGLNALNAAISGISGNNVVELTQAQYDALVTGGTVDPSAFYIITDATAGDLTQYWTSAQTQSAITSAVSGKVDTSTFETYSGSVDTALSGKQDTLSAGTGISIVDNVISATGGGGGKAVSGGTNISITTGETADTINCTLPISGDSKGIYNTSSYPFEGNSFKSNNIVFGIRNKINKNNSGAFCTDNLMFGADNNIGTGEYGYKNLNYNFVGGSNNKIYADTTVESSFIAGWYNEIRNSYETALGKANVSHTGSTDADKTLFSVGNGTTNNARHNAFEIRQNGDIYITSGGTDIKLQDQLGGGGVTVDQTIISGSTNAVAGGAVYSKIDEVEQVTAAALNDLNDTIGNINTILESI